MNHVVGRSAKVWQRSAAVGTGQVYKALVKDVQVFAKLWRRNFETFMLFRGDPAAHFIFFEDLMNNPDKHLAELSAHCNVVIDRETLNIRIRGIQKPARPVTSKEEEIIRKICGDLAQPFGYLGYKKTHLSQ